MFQTLVELHTEEDKEQQFISTAEKKEGTFLLQGNKQTFILQRIYLTDIYLREESLVVQNSFNRPYSYCIAPSGQHEVIFLSGERADISFSREQADLSLSGEQTDISLSG